MTLFQNTSCEFPLLRDRFWPECALVLSSSNGSHRRQASGDSKSSSQRLTWAAASGDAEASHPDSSPGRQSSCIDCTSLDMAAGLSRRYDGDQASEAAPRGRFGLRTLDLQALPRDDAGPPSELGARRQKFAQFEGQCSEVVPGLCVGGGAVARSRDTLRAAGVTHVVNCVGMLIPPCFEPELQYLTLFMQDVPGEDLTSLLYTVFDFIEAARRDGGCVLVHCSQGVSRSAALVIGYLMWKLDQSYDEVYQAVKAIRGVANPNIGFTCQLLQWQKRRAASEPPPARVLRIAPASPSTPAILVAKPTALDGSCDTAGIRGLDPRGVFLLLRHQHCFVWQGKDASQELLQGGLEAAEALRRYEGVAAYVVVNQGEEPREALDTLLQAGADGSEACHRPEWDGDFQAMAQQTSGHLEQGSQQEHSRNKMPVPRMSLGSSTSLAAIGSGDTPRGSKTPRSARRSGSSPNARARKSQRSQLQLPLSPGRPSLTTTGPLTDDSCESSDSSKLGGSSESDSSSSDDDHSQLCCTP